VWAQLESDGTPIGAHDLWIAATALSHGMDIATTNDRDFKRVPGLTVVPI
jgi:predicted nucleic acid-binding protein